MGVDKIYGYLDELNPQQREAVTYHDGPSLVIAGAGSGKTRVLTYKIVDLLRHGFEPYRVLALTFTNKAAREMQERIQGLVGDKVAARLKMGTFHSVFLSILRQNYEKIGFKSGFTIYDSADSKSLIKMIIKELGLDEKVYKLSSVLSNISYAKNALISAEQYVIDPDKIEYDKATRRPLTGRIYQLYCERCRLANAMDFDDILFYMNELLRDHPDVKRHYQDFFKYILVDEYQDTNFAQHLILQQLIGENKRICVVGDDAQSIYSFRGAQIENILGLRDKMPELKIFKLERNYRSTQNIIDAAGSLIGKNTRQIPKNLYSENKIGAKIEVISAYSDIEEAFIIANLINKHKLTFHDSYEDYAILYRTNAQSRVIEESLRKRSIPYRIYGGLSFYQRKEVKDAVAYFRMAVNPNDDEAFRRIINFPARGIGETTLKKISAAAIEKGVSLWEIISSSNLKAIGINSGTSAKLNNFKQLIDEFIKDNNQGSNAYELGQLIFNRTGILNLYAHDSTPESVSRYENLTEIMSGLKDFVESHKATNDGEPNMVAFLSEVMLATDQDEEDQDNLQKVSLMTVHAAKGLEFRHVYIVGVEEDLFPAAMSQTSISEVEEERRLLYVAMTRAMETCVITYATRRFRNGQTVITNPSRFISDINPKFLDLKSSSQLDKKSQFVNPVDNYKKHNIYSAFSTNSPDINSNNPNNSSTHNLRKVGSPVLSYIKPQHTQDELAEGMVIDHEKFGKGTIQSLGSISGEPSITVNFDEVGIKRLILRFAKFSVVK